MTFAPRTWVVGEVVTAALLNQEIRDQFASIFAAWTAYTPVWASTGTAPALGNGTLIGRNMKIGRSVIAQIQFTAGSTSTYGSGDYSFTLPATSANAGTTHIGNAHLLQSSTRYAGQILIIPNASSATFSFPTSNVLSTHSIWGQGAPITLAAGAQNRITALYEAAA